MAAPLSPFSFLFPLLSLSSLPLSSGLKIQESSRRNWDRVAGKEQHEAFTDQVRSSHHPDNLSGFPITMLPSSSAGWVPELSCFLRPGCFPPSFFSFSFFKLLLCCGESGFLVSLHAFLPDLEPETCGPLVWSLKRRGLPVMPCPSSVWWSGGVFGGGLSVCAAHYATASSLNQPQSFTIRLLISSLMNDSSFAEQLHNKTILHSNVIKSLSGSFLQKWIKKK